ncbi:MAG: cobalamin biosynthesis protein CbiD [Oscillospiraceae bacterium]|nr:cobalamin biosynthesis protein CbiD [Oscillospiraceae bacterium]
MERYLYKGTKKLRCGYTTGSCATAAAKSAGELLLTGHPVHNADILLPNGERISIPIQESHLTAHSAVCSVVKDSGDDPDVTNGILICAELSLIPETIQITGGQGVGIVTKPGLDQPLGESAINSVPRKMIQTALHEISELYEYQGGFRVVISVPEGAEIAKKTYNPRMGIQGGISIIGTTGIVEPMSNSALVATIRTEAGIRKAEGRQILLLTLGNYSEQFLKMNLSVPEQYSVSCSNFIGDAVDIGISLGFSHILLIGHIGKMVKLGAGIMNTHSHIADGRMETLITCGVLAGAPISVLQKLPDCATADSALTILKESGYLEQTLAVLIRKIDFHLQARAGENIEIGAMVFSYQHDILLKTPSADNLLNYITKEGSCS